MSTNKWVYERATGKWLLEFRDPAIYLTDVVNYGLADLGTDKPSPDPITERYDPTTGRRPATVPEVLDSQADLADSVAAKSIDTARILSSLLWALIDTIAPPVTLNKYLAARAKVLTAYKGQPWK